MLRVEIISEKDKVRVAFKTSFSLYLGPKIIYLLVFFTVVSIAMVATIDFFLTHIGIRISLFDHFKLEFNSSNSTIGGLVVLWIVIGLFIIASSTLVAYLEVRVSNGCLIVGRKLWFFYLTNRRIRIRSIERIGWHSEPLKPEIHVYLTIDENSTRHIFYVGAVNPEANLEEIKEQMQEAVSFLQGIQQQFDTLDS